MLSACEKVIECFKVPLVNIPEQAAGFRSGSLMTSSVLVLSWASVMKSLDMKVFIGEDCVTL